MEARKSTVDWDLISAMVVGVVVVEALVRVEGRSSRISPI